MHRIIYSLITLSISLLPLSLFSAEEESTRGGIEEITVTAEKRTSTVSDTSMSISAFDASLIEDLGLQGANDLMDQLPATTRDGEQWQGRGGRRRRDPPRHRAHRVGAVGHPRPARFFSIAPLGAATRALRFHRLRPGPRAAGGSSGPADGPLLCPE